MVVDVTEHHAYPLSAEVPALPSRIPRYVIVLLVPVPVDVAKDFAASEGNVFEYVVVPDPAAKIVVLFVKPSRAYDVYADSDAVFPANVSSNAAAHRPK